MAILRTRYQLAHTPTHTHLASCALQYGSRDQGNIKDNIPESARETADFLPDFRPTVIFVALVDSKLAAYTDLHLPSRFEAPY